MTQEVKNPAVTCVGIISVSYSTPDSTRLDQEVETGKIEVLNDRLSSHIFENGQV